MNSVPGVSAVLETTGAGRLRLLCALVGDEGDADSRISRRATALRRSRWVMSLASGAGPSTAIMTLRRGAVVRRISSSFLWSSAWNWSWLLAAWARACRVCAVWVCVGSGQTASNGSWIQQQACKKQPHRGHQTNSNQAHLDAAPCAARC